MTSRRSRLRLLRQQGSTTPKLVPAGATRQSVATVTAVAAVAAASALGFAALVNHRLAERAARDNPPSGNFVQVDGVRVHYVERGRGEPLVFLHGNGMMVADFETSGLLDMAASRYRVIAFDRPGYGHTDRPRTTFWTDAAQADLIGRALSQLGVSRAIVLGHSWGCAVAVALALNHPETVSALVLESGYYYPSVRVDVVAASGPAIPVIGDLIRYTTSPILARLMWPLLTRKIFGPAPVPEKFAAFPKEMTFRPSQIRASAADAALMIPDARARQGRYRELAMPVFIIAGEDDEVVDIDDQSARLHAELAHSRFERVPGVGHMVHQSAPSRVMSAIDAAEDAGSAREGLPLAA